MKSTKGVKNSGIFQTERGAMSVSRNTLIVIGICIAIVLVSIVALSWQSRKNSTEKANTYKQGYSDGFQTARSLTPSAMESGSKASTSVLEGHVKSVSQKEMRFTVTNLLLDEQVDGIGLERTAKVNNQTKFVVISQKTDADFKKEQDAYFTKYGASNNDVAPPTPFSQVDGTMSDVQVGDFVSVEGVSASDIAYTSDIDAGIVKVMRISGAQE